MQFGECTAGSATATHFSVCAGNGAGAAIIYSGALGLALHLVGHYPAVQRGRTARHGGLMLVYRCAHCGEILGPVPQVPEPICPNHPDGVVQEYDDGDPQPE